MLHKLGGQPESYEKKSKYKFGKTLGAGTYGVVREATGPNGKVAIKIILKKNVKGHELMVYDELHMLKLLNHPHIVKFIDWFESKDKFYIVTQLAIGGELFDRICDHGRFTEKDASQTIKQVLSAVDYMHSNQVVHRDLKPENLLYVTKDPDSDLVLADFGIAKELDNKQENLQTMAGSFGYAAPEVMNREGHGKPVDMWSLGVITYTLLCGYSPFRSENLTDLLEECTQNPVIFHDRYWKDVSEDAKDFIRCLIVPNPDDRATSQEALKHIWLSGQNATEHDLLPELRRAKEARAKLRKAILAIQLQKRIARLRHEADEDDDNDLQDAAQNVETSGLAKAFSGVSVSSGSSSGETKKPSLKDTVRSGAVFREVVLAKVREEKAKKEAALQTDEDLVQEARRRSFNTQNS
ncbi:calcium/calmodulin-dependent protein kinase [Cordyceps javanica]|nr:calcium/calmodulin-dependent protein kinase [Cordyceps javanica]